MYPGGKKHRSLPRSGSPGFSPLAWLPVLLLSLTIAAAQPKSGLQKRPGLDQAVALEEGRARISELLSRQPTEKSINTGVLHIREPNRKWRQVPITFSIKPGLTNWISTYEAKVTDPVPGTFKLVVRGQPGRPNKYELTRPGVEPRTLAGNETMIPFAGSDFWIADLGLEFFHWPTQLFLRNEIRRGQSSDVIESINPNPAPGAYSRVLTWVDVDTGGIVHAEAFDSNNRLLKVFDPKSFEKVEGQWQLEEMEIANRQANTRSRIQFKLE